MNNTAQEKLNSQDLKSDGYVYCIVSGPRSKYVKIGRTEMKNRQSEQAVRRGLRCRYGTYYLHFRVLHFQRVGDNEKAEAALFHKLKDLHIKKEFFQYNPKRIKQAFKEVQGEFPHLNNIIGKLNWQELNEINTQLREY
jgi:hypothetical protein